MSNISTIQKRILSQRQGDFSPEDEIIFEIGANEVGLMNGKNSYFRCEVTLAAGQTGVGAKGSLDYHGGGGFSLFDRVDIWSGDQKTLIESCESVPMYVGNMNYYDQTQGLLNQRQLLEGLTSSDGSVPSNPFSQYYSMPALDGEPHYEQVELILPLRFSGVFYQKMMPIIATQGLVVKILLNTANRAITADLVNGFVIQRDRTGRLPTLQDLPYLPAEPTTGWNIQGHVSQQLPQTWQCTAGVGPQPAHGDLEAGSTCLPLTAPAPTGCGAGPFPGLVTTTSGGGTLATVDVVIVATNVSTCVISAGGPFSGYAIGDTVTVAAALLGGANVNDLVFTLVAANMAGGGAVTGCSLMVTDVVAPLTPLGTSLALPTLRPNVLTSATSFCSLVGQHFFVVDDTGALVDLAPNGILTVAATASTVDITFAPITLTAPFSTVNKPPGFGCILDPNLVATNAQSMTYIVKNPSLVLESVSLGAGSEQALLKSLGSENGFSMDIKSYTVLKQNLYKNQTVSQLLLPVTARRMKSVIEHQQLPYQNLNSSYYHPVNDNLNSYQYQIQGQHGNKNVPSRAVPTNLEYSPELNSWNALADSEKTKALEGAGVAVRRESMPANRFLFGRQLAKLGHSFSGTANTIRLTQNWGVTQEVSTGVTANVLPQFDKTLNTIVPCFRKLTVQGDNVVITY
jgi:hypothetical protein